MKYFKKGFTLLEIIIVIGIISIVIGGGTRIYSISFSERKLNTESEALTNILQAVKQRTVSRDISPLINTIGCTNFQGYSVLIHSDGTYEDEIICDSSAVVLNTYRLENVVFDGLTSDLLLNFTYPYGSLDTTSQIIQIKSDRIDQCITITIPQLGPIKKSESFVC